MQTLALTTDQSKQIVESLAEGLGISTDDIQRQLVGPSWGEEITKKALENEQAAPRRK